MNIQPSRTARKPAIHVVNTGGTIASRYREQAGGWVSDASAQDLVATIPEIAEHADLHLVEHSQVNGYRIDTSTVVALARRVRALVARDDVDGVVVTHGTATLEETAYMLDLLVASDKPVVITGAQRRFDDAGADGPMNLLSSVRAAADSSSSGRGVLAVFDSRIFPARDVIKVHTHSLAAFAARDGGPIGHASRDGVHYFARPDRRPTFDVEDVARNVQLVKLVQGGNDLLLRACVDGGVDGIVIEGISSGHANDPAAAAIQDALTRGIPVVIVPRILFGGNNVKGTRYAQPGAVHSLIEAGAIAGGFLSGLKARILLMVALSATRNREALQRIFSNA